MYIYYMSYSIIAPLKQYERLRNYSRRTNYFQKKEMPGRKHGMKCGKRKCTSVETIATDIDEEETSAYEKLREINILRNQELFTSLGLQAISFASSHPITNTSSFFEKKRKRQYEVLLPVRRSDRVSSLVKKEVDHSNAITFANRSAQTEVNMVHVKHEIDIFVNHAMKQKWQSADRPTCFERTPDFAVTVDDEGVTRRKLSALELRNLINETNPNHSKEISNDAIHHCLYRILSMSNCALAARLRKITKAAGKNAREKLLIFSYALCAFGLPELAFSAKNALENLA